MSNVFIDDREIKKAVDKLVLVPKKIPGATAQAINRTVTYTVTLVKRETTQIYAVKQGDVAATLKKKKATRGDLRGYVESTGRPIELSKFPYNPKKTGKKRKSVKVKVRKDNGYQKIETKPSAFTNNSQIWQRKGKDRFPIKKLYTLSIPNMIANPEVMNPIMEKANAKLIERINHEVERRLK